MGIKFFFGDDMLDLEKEIERWLSIWHRKITSVSTQWIDSRKKWYITVVYENMM